MLIVVNCAVGWCNLYLNLQLVHLKWDLIQNFRNVSTLHSEYHDFELDLQVPGFTPSRIEGQIFSLHVTWLMIILPRVEPTTTEIFPHCRWKTYILNYQMKIKLEKLSKKIISIDCIVDVKWITFKCSEFISISH